MERKSVADFSEVQWDDSEGTSLDSTVLSSINTMEDLAGKIKSLHMVNFMCHSNIEIEFNKRVNFITGSNGSGKSAIMAALVVVLGGNAALTNRGSGITDFIKKGSNWAKVTITLINDGLNSFKKEIYGSRVIITRNISASGSHGYVCKSADGGVVARKKEEVDAIVLAFNLQIKNPICVLNQDVARSFLCATDSSLRFAMFAKATQLEQLKTIYVKTFELLVASRKCLTDKQKGILEASEEINQLKEKLEVFASLENRVRERTDLENEYLWALVVSEEKKVQELQETRLQLLERKKEHERGETDFQRMLTELDIEIKNRGKELEELKKVKNEKWEEKFRFEREVHALERQLEKSEAQLAASSRKLTRQLKEIEGVQEHLKFNDDRASQSQAEKEQAMKKMEVLERRLSEVKEELPAAQRELARAEESSFEATTSVEAAKEDVEDLEHNKRRLEVTLAEMVAVAQAKGQGNLLKYGQHTQELLRAIDEAAAKNCFIRKPVGPCGMHVTLSGNPKWARAVEYVVGGLMTAYRCDNEKDYHVLSKIMERVCREKHPTIIIGKFLRSRHDVEERKVSVPGLPSVLDVLSFDDDVVYNTFIDQARIETVLLFETDQQAASFLTYIQNVPKNLRMGVTLQSDQYFPAPNYRTYHGNPDGPLKYFDDGGKDADTAKRLQGRLSEAERVLAEKRSELERAREASAASNALFDRCKGRVKALRQEEMRLRLELNHLRDMEEIRPVPIRQVALEEELENLEKSRKAAAEEEARCKEAAEGLRRARDEAATRLNSAALEEEEAESSLTAAKEEVEEKRAEYWKLTGKRKRAGDQLGEIGERLQEVEDEIGKREAAAESRKREAEEVCSERVETQRSPLEVQKLLDKCQKYLKAAEKMVGSREATIAEYKTKMELYEGMKKTGAVLEKTIETLTTAALQKEQKLKVLESHTASLVSFYFQAMLQTRGYDGQLKVDFENKVLDLEVKPKDAAIATKDPKTLSGGERSYSTVSFILAIWKVVQVPVYFLDEFDVFMDQVNRKVIMDLLLEHANAQSNKQFVFITPQDISSIQPSDAISVYRLPDPERRKD